MKILLIDCRKPKRALILQKILAAGNRHEIVHACHVNGPDGGFDTPNDLDGTKKQALIYLQSVQPDMVLLHVSNDQAYAKECLAQVYQDCIVVCFSGRGIPDEVEKDCANNHRHCYYPGAFATEFPKQEDWLSSTEVSALTPFIDAVEQYLQEDKVTPAKALETLKKAKAAFQHFDPYLEDILKELTAKLRELLLQDPPPTPEQLAEQFKSLADERDELLKHVDA